MYSLIFKYKTMSESIANMDKSVKCLALELPASVWNDVNQKWQEVKQGLEKVKSSLGEIVHGHETEVLNEKLACSEMAAVAKNAIALL